MTEEVQNNEQEQDTSFLNSEIENEEEVKEQKEEKPSDAENQEESDDESGDSQEEKTDKEKSEGAPEKYEDFNLPEEMEVDEALLEKAVPIFKDLNLSQEQAQQLVDLQAEFAKQEHEKTVEAWDNTLKEWETATRNDKEFGGKELDQNMPVMKAAIDQFGTDEFKQMLDMTGVGNHPEMARFIYRVGKAIADDKILHGNSNTNKSDDPASLLYPTMKS